MPMIAATSPRKKRATAAEQRIKEKWSKLPADYSEQNLTMSFVQQLFEELGVDSGHIKHTPSINLPGTPGLKPDLLIYRDLATPPVLVVELKKRVPELAECEDEGFVSYCKQHRLYRSAVGYPDSSENGILQYLDNGAVRPDSLASYGLILNGDFFQLWRRVDGLIFPVTTLQRMTEKNVVELCRQIRHCLNIKPPGLVVALWNRKGGVGKTTNTINIAASLALRGKRVLLVDLDPQNDLTDSLGFKSFTSSYLEEVGAQIALNEVEASREILGKFIQKQLYPTSDKQHFHLRILSACKNSLENFLRDEDDMAIPRTVFFERLFKILKDDYDYIFIDASPTVNKLVTGLFAVCDIVLPPMDFDPTTVNHTIDVRKNLIPSIRLARKRRANFFVGPWNLDVVFSNAPAKLNVYDNKLIERLVSHGFNRQKIENRRDNRIVSYCQTRAAKENKKPVICWRDSPAAKCYDNFVESVFVKHNYTDY